MKLRININGCHGIKSLDETLEFDDKPVIIHAPNGTFKTSLCKTIEEWINGEDSLDVVTGITGNRVIEVDGKLANPKDFEVFSDFSNTRPLDNSNGILINPSLRNTYDAALSSYESIRDNFLKSFGAKFKINKIESIICRVFLSDDVDEALKKIYFKINRKKKICTFKGNYTDYFSDTIAKNISKPSSKQIIGKYQRIYNKTLKKAFISGGVFELNNLINISESLFENNYFEAGNQILLKGEKPIATSKDFNSFIDKIKNEICKDADVQEAFIGLENDFSKRGMNKVPEAIRADPLMAKFYQNYPLFEELFLLDKFRSCKTDLSNVLNQYKISRNTIRKIKKIARKDDEIWKKVVSTFKNRFKMPFEIIISDKFSAVLGIEDVAYQYQYVINGKKYQIEEETLVNGVLSEGETRVFSLLNMLFKIEELEKTNKHKVLIFDDVADAFDYSNKHAIIEYLCDISSKSIFDVIVLTHNFDFYRHFGNRVSGRNACKFGSSDGYGNISFSEGGYLKNLYTNYLRKNAEKPNGINHALAIVPFARAAQEIINPNYEKNDQIYDFLTEILHYRPKCGARLTGNTYAKTIKKLLGINCISLLGNKNKLYKIIYNQASYIASLNTIDQKVEEKIVLSMAMRIFGEKYMIYQLKRVGANKRGENIGNLQFGQLFELFKKYLPNKESIDILDIIHIFTPVEIHVNGFAYEPLIDYSIVRLRKLFAELNHLLGKTLRP